MNQTGVVSTGSRRQALRKREVDTSRVSAGKADVEQFARERHQLFEPQWLVAKLGAERGNLGRLRIIQVIVASDDRDWRVREARDGSQGPQHLEAAREWHAEVEDDGVRPVRLRQRQPFVRGQSGPDFVAFEPQHSGKGIGDADVVIDDEYTGSVGAALGRRHAPIVGRRAGGVKSGGDSPIKPFSFAVSCYILGACRTFPVPALTRMYSPRRWT